MRKIVLKILLVFLFLAPFWAAFPVLAASVKNVLVDPMPGIMPPIPNNNLPVFGQDHYYTVTFRGNGEAVVTAKIIFTNTAKENLSEINLRVPQVNPGDLIAYQVIKDRQCIQYLAPVGRPEASTCAQYQEPDYYQFWGEAKYQQTKARYAGDTITINLPKSIAPEASGSFLLYFRAFGYARKNFFAAYDYVFETLKTDDKIHSLQVGINSDSDLYLRGAKGKVAYRFEFEAPTMAAKVAGAEPTPNTQMDSFYRQIGQGTIVKNASSLAPLESYKVTGSYADAAWRTYGREILTGFGVTTGLLLLVVTIVKILLRRVVFSDSRVTLAGLSLGTGFAAALLVLGYTILIWLFYQYFFGRVYIGSLGAMVTVLIAVVSVGVYSLLVFLPGMVMGLKKGWIWGLVTFGSTIVWLGISLAVLLLVMVLSAARPIPLPIPVLDGRAQSSSVVK